jgi:5'-nucleotidase
MAEPIDHSKCRILISNDDGIASPGIKVLEKVARELSNDVWLSRRNRASGASHSRRRAFAAPRAVGEQRYAVDGTPTDCVLLASSGLLTGPDPSRRASTAAAMSVRI